MDLLPDDLAGPRTVTTRDRFGKVTTQLEETFPIARLAVEVGGSLHIGPVG